MDAARRRVREKMFEDSYNRSNVEECYIRNGVGGALVISDLCDSVHMEVETTTQTLTHGGEGEADHMAEDAYSQSSGGGQRRKRGSERDRLLHMLQPVRTATTVVQLRPSHV